MKQLWDNVSLGDSPSDKKFVPWWMVQHYGTIAVRKADLMPRVSLSDRTLYKPTENKRRSFPTIDEHSRPDDISPNIFYARGVRAGYESNSARTVCRCVSTTRIMNNKVASVGRGSVKWPISTYLRPFLDCRSLCLKVWIMPRSFLYRNVSRRWHLGAIQFFTSFGLVTLAYGRTLTLLRVTIYWWRSGHKCM